MALLTQNREALSRDGLGSSGLAFKHPLHRGQAGTTRTQMAVGQK